MNQLVLPTRMGALASNASAALRLLGSTKQYEPLILKGLRQARQFCEVINTGNTVKAGADRFSPDSYRARRFVDLVCTLPDGANLAEKTRAVTTALDELIAMAEHTTAPTEANLQVSEELRAYFSAFARLLPYYENMRRRLETELPSTA